MRRLGRLPVGIFGSVALLLLVTACETGAATTTSESTQPVVESDFSAMTGEEQVAAFVSCLNARSFPVVLLEDNELDSSAVPRTAQARYRQGIEVCSGAVYVACLNRRGFPVVLLEDNELDASAVPRTREEQARYRQASEVCGTDVAHGALGELVEAEHSKDRLSALYSSSLDIYRCVLAHGYIPAEPPAEEVYVESQGAAWYPYEDLDLPSDEFERLQDLCRRP